MFEEDTGRNQEESSTSEDLDVSTDNGGQDSSSGQGSAETLEAIYDRVFEDEDGDDDGEAEESHDSEEDAEDSEEKPDDAEDDEEKDKVPFGKHPRFQELLKENKESREKLKELDTHRKSTEFVQGLEQMVESTIGLEQFGNVLQAIQLYNEDPTKAYELMRPFMANIIIASGKGLPQDLADEVKAGQMTRERAVELAQLRRQTDDRTLKAARTTQVQSQYEQARAAEQEREMSLTAETWVNAQRTKDPLFEKKSKTIMRFAVALDAEEGPVKTAKDMQARLDRIKSEVDALYGRPVTKSSRPVPQGNGETSVKKKQNFIVKDSSGAPMVDGMSIIDSIFE